MLYHPAACAISFHDKIPKTPSHMRALDVFDAFTKPPGRETYRPDDAQGCWVGDTGATPERAMPDLWPTAPKTKEERSTTGPVTTRPEEAARDKSNGQRPCRGMPRTRKARSGTGQ